MTDSYGDALRDFRQTAEDAELEIFCNICDTDQMQVSWFFRSFDLMPRIEKTALGLCSGTVLDVGAGAGAHALYLKNKGLEVHPIDNSPGAVEVMKQRGLSSASLDDFFKLKNQKYDTVLMLMNGLGIIGKLSRLPEFFLQLDSLLVPGGQLLADSSDILYMFEEEDGSFMIDLNAGYYGELEYRMDYLGRKGRPFPWLFIDFHSLADSADRHGFHCELLEEDEHYHYLARLTRK